MSIVEFPALWIAKEGSFGVVARPLDTVACRAYASGFLDGLRFFDAMGTMHEVIRVIPRAPPSLLDRLFNRRVTVALELRATPPLTVHDVASLLCGIIDGDPDDLYDQERSPDELKASFRSAPDAAALIARARTLGG